MYRPRSAHQLYTSSNNSCEKLTPELEGEQNPYDNAKHAKASVKSRVMPFWHGHTAAAAQRARGTSLVLLLLCVVLWAQHVRTRLQASQPRYLVVLDAGSTGTRVHVFQYTVDISSSYAVLKLPEPKLKVQPGLSAYAGDAAGAAASIQPLLQFAAQHVPAAQVATTPVYLMATAGLRLLPTAAAEGILMECRNALLASDFMFQPEWAHIISGTYEGLYAWVAANYAAGHLQDAAEDAAVSRKDLHSGRAPFKALIEMGGASAQVTFMPEPHWHRHTAGGSSKQRVRLKLPGVNQPLWSHSYLGYGFDVVQAKVDALVQQLASHAAANSSSSTPGSSMQPPAATAAGDSASPPAGHIEAAAAGQPGSSSATLPQASAAVHVGAEGVMDPCLPAGYRSLDGRVGSGVWQQCQQLVEAVIDPRACKPVHDTPCPELPDAMPKLTGELLAIENFAYTANALSLPSVATLGDFASAARQFCSRPWPQTLQAHNTQPEQQPYLWRYCFGSAFAWTLLHQVLRIGEGQPLHFTNILRRQDGAELGLDWALGAAVLQLANNSAAEGARAKHLQHKQQLLLLGAVAATVALAMVVGLTWQGAARPAKPGQQPAWLAAVVSSSGSNGVGTTGGWSSLSGVPTGRPAVKPGHTYAYQHLRL